MKKLLLLIMLLPLLSFAQANTGSCLTVGHKTEAELKQEKFTGEIFEYDNDGNVTLSVKYKNGLKNGLYTETHKDGTKRTVNYKEGNPVFERTYNSSGKTVFDLSFEEQADDDSEEKPADGPKVGMYFGGYSVYGKNIKREYIFPESSFWNGLSIFPAMQELGLPVYVFGDPGYCNIDEAKSVLSRQGYTPGMILDGSKPLSYSGFDAVVLFHVTNLRASVVKALSDYVNAGGGLIIADANGTSEIETEEAAETFRNLAGFDSVACSQIKNNKTVFTLMKEHPITEGLKAGDKFENSIISDGFSGKSVDGDTLMSFEDGRVALKAKNFGKGRVVVLNWNFNTRFPSYWCPGGHKFGSVTGYELFRRCVSWAGSFAEKNIKPKLPEKKGDGSKEGFITGWWLIGPFGRGVDRPFMPEKDGFNTAKEYFGKAATVKWEYHEFKDGGGYVDLCSVMDPNYDTTAYAYITLVSETEKKVKFLFGKNDQFAIFLNGKRIYISGDVGQAKPDSANVEATLLAGENKLMLKPVDFGGSGWGYFFRLVELNGGVVKGVGVKN